MNLSTSFGNEKVIVTSGIGFRSGRGISLAHSIAQIEKMPHFGGSIERRAKQGKIASVEAVVYIFPCHGFLAKSSKIILRGGYIRGGIYLLFSNRSTTYGR
jgi:hypothetical protein